MKSDEDMPPNELAVNNEARARVRTVIIIWLAVILAVFTFFIWLLAGLESTGG